MYYWLKLPKDFFIRNDIRIIESLEDGKNILLIYLKMLSASAGTYGVIPKKIRYIHALIDCPIKEVEMAIPLLEKFELIKPLNEDEYQLKHCNQDTVYRSSDYEGRDRNAPEYKAWRNDVFERDNYTCQKCHKTGCRLEAHHIVPWSKNRELRFDVNNGMTLCYDCHKKIHKKGEEKEWQKEECLQKQ